VDSGGLGKKGSPLVEFAFAIAATPFLERPLLTIAPRWIAVAGINQAVSRKAAFSEERINLLWDLNHMKGTRDAIIARFRAPASQMKEHLHEIMIPTLILWGEQDRIVPVEAAHAFQSAIQHSRLIIYPNTGHLPQEEVPDESAADVRAFLTNSRSSRKPVISTRQYSTVFPRKPPHGGPVGEGSESAG
jgi:pimeloyl-ACP methyl ester carboxylesterase